MNCYIKRYNQELDKWAYFNKNISKNQNHWTPKEEAKVFGSVKEARANIITYKLKNCEIEKVKK